MTPLESLRKIAEAASPGPWQRTNLSVGLRDAEGNLFATACKDADKNFVATFNPALVKLLLNLADAAYEIAGPTSTHPSMGDCVTDHYFGKVCDCGWRSTSDALEAIREHLEGGK